MSLILTCQTMVKPFFCFLSLCAGGNPRTQTPAGNHLTCTLWFCVSQLSSSPAPVFSQPPHTPPLTTPQSNIMAQSKVTHIYPIKQGFEKTRIGLQLMLQWGPETERCYRTERLEFQGSCEQKAVQSSERKGRKKGLGGWRCGGGGGWGVGWKGSVRLA